MEVFLSILGLALVLLLNGLLASKASSVAQDKGYPKCTWFHMCFWLGPISYVIIAAMPDLELQQKQDETNCLLGELVKSAQTAPQATSTNQADVSSFLPEL